MEIWKLSIYIVGVAVILSIINTLFFLKIEVSDQTPTIVNGIVSSISILIGFCLAFIGIIFREIDKKDQEARGFYLNAIISLLVVCCAMPYLIYSFLIANTLQIAVKWGLIALIITIYLVFLVVAYTVKILGAVAKKK
jgi:predicted permease